MSNPAPSQRRWLFSAPVDLAVFLGSALCAVAALVVGAWLGLLHGGDTSTPEWTWITTILLIDVAHVWATGFRVYFVPQELRRRPLLYALVPLVGFLLGVALYAESSLLFWRVLAYLAVFHFVRQQYGWVALYRARLGETGAWGRFVDTSAIYLSMLYPLVWWHAYGPRRFHWFLPGDFVTVPEMLATVLAPLYWLALITYVGRAAWLWLIAKRPNPGKDIVVATTALCWHIGIITFNSDYAFTVTNVIIHGIPYMVLVFWYRHKQSMSTSHRLWWSRVLVFLATIWLLAYVEELLWDRGVWQERSWLFGTAWMIEEWHIIIVPLLAVPQFTHYILDGFIWRRKSNPDLAAALS